MRRLRRRSPAELADRTIQAIRILAERTGMAPLAKAPADAPIRPTLPFPRPTGAELQAVYGNRAEERGALLDVADAALDDRFHLLGFRDLRYGTPVDWQLDPVHQRRAPGGHWSQVPYLDEGAVGDHKIIWELNRHQWLVTLAQAWRLTGDRRYLERIALALEGWLDANQPRQGINWASSLELAFRAIAWTWVLHLADGALPDSRQLHRRLMDALVHHGTQITAHLSTWFSPNTHLTGEALGLLYLGVAWPALPQAERWKHTGWRILLEQLPIQVRRDGSYFEQSSWYQGYSTDFYLHALLLARAASLDIPGWAEERISAAVSVVAALLRPDGTLPLIGDDDGGRLLPLLPSRNDFRDTVALGHAALARPGTCSSVPIPAATAWLVGRSAWEQLHAPGPGPDPGLSVAFPDGGWFLLRSGDGTLVVDAGPHGALAGGHSHADALAFDLTVGGRPIIVDPGTGAYVGPWRDALRATSAHNTLCLADGTGSARPTGIFRWGRWPVVTVRHWSVGPEWVAFEAEHDGFTGAIPGLVHRRTILHRGGWGWLVLDRLLGAEAESRLHLQLAPGLEVMAVDGVVTTRSPDGLPQLRIIPDSGRLEQDRGLVSPTYGVARDAAAVWRPLNAAEGRRGAAMLLTPWEDGALTTEGAGGEMVWLWSVGGTTARVSIGAGGVTTLRAGHFALTLD